MSSLPRNVFPEDLNMTVVPAADVTPDWVEEASRLPVAFAQVRKDALLDLGVVGSIPSRRSRISRPRSPNALTSTVGMYGDVCDDTAHTIKRVQTHDANRGALASGNPQHRVYVRIARLNECFNSCLCWFANGFGKNTHHILRVQHFSKIAFVLHL